MPFLRNWSRKLSIVHHTVANESEERRWHCRLQHDVRCTRRSTFDIEKRTLQNGDDAADLTRSAASPKLAPKPLQRSCVCTTTQHLFLEIGAKNTPAFTDTTFVRTDNSRQRVPRLGRRAPQRQTATRDEVTTVSVVGNTTFVGDSKQFRRIKDTKQP